MAMTLAILGALALLFTAGYHLTGLREVSAGLEGERLGLTRGAWIGIAVDWILLAFAWLAAAFGWFPAIVLTVTSALPLAAALILIGTLGLKFPGVWLLAFAGFCALFAGYA